MTAPRVLISYSHESSEHEQQVLEFTQQLRRDGVDAWIDRFEPAPPQGWPRWMHEQIERADFIVLVCTETYRQRFESKPGSSAGRGVTWEGMLARQLLYENRLDLERLVPVMFDGIFRDVVPTEVRGATHHMVYSGYAQLVARLTRTLAVPPAPLNPVYVSRGMANRPTIDEGRQELWLLREQVERRTRAGEDAAALKAVILDIQSQIQRRPQNGKLLAAVGAGLAVSVGAMIVALMKSDSPEGRRPSEEFDSQICHGSEPADIHRFSLTECGSIIDLQSGLEWCIGPDKDYTWNEARSWAASLSACGGGWRMPEIAELAPLRIEGSPVGDGWRFKGETYRANMDAGFSGIGHGAWVWADQAEESASTAPICNFYITSCESKATTDGYNDKKRGIRFSIRAFAVRRAD
jgi:hypothetical protein